MPVLQDGDGVSGVFPTASRGHRRSSTAKGQKFPCKKAYDAGHFSCKWFLHSGDQKFIKVGSHQKASARRA